MAQFPLIAGLLAASTFKGDGFLRGNAARRLIQEHDAANSSAFVSVAVAHASTADANVLATETKFPASVATALLNGFDIDAQSAGTPFLAIDTCENTGDDIKTPCIETGLHLITDPSTGYLETVTDLRSKETFFSTLVKAEGGSVGVKVSASVGYIESSSVTEESVSHFIGGTVAANVERIRHPQNLKLNPSAKAVLQIDPMGFLSTYGQYFVTAITYGGSFLGSYTMNSRNSANSDELKAEASFSYSGGLYSASGSLEFMDKQATLEESLEIKADYRCIPDTGAAREVPENPAALNKIYTDWSVSARENPPS